MTWRPSSASSTTWCAPCRRPAAWSSTRDEDSLQRVLAQGCWSEVAALRRRRRRTGRPAATHDAFDVLRSGERVGRVEWALSGQHNQMNALAAIAAAEHVGVAPAKRRPALGSFRNVRRRMELRGTVERAADRSASTTTSPTTRPPSAPRSTACATSSTPAASRRAHPGRVRAAQQHHEAGRHGGAAALEPGGGRPGLLPQRRPGLGRRRSAGADGRRGRRWPARSSRWWRRSSRPRGPATTSSA